MCNGFARSQAIGIRFRVGADEQCWFLTDFHWNGSYLTARRTRSKDFLTQRNVGLSVTWIGNLVGALTIAAVVHLAGGGSLLDDGRMAFLSTLAQKETVGIAQLLARSAICSWLLSLAVWMSNLYQSTFPIILPLLCPLCVLLIAGPQEYALGKSFYILTCTYRRSSDRCRLGRCRI
ncbi:formate/nitrite transporter family protein [Rhizobium grahamii]